jgi:transcription initiation factor TFIIIB Brf1 subunit/transcription initiation factor TFIIB
VIQKICKRLALRQQVIATAITFFRRFYLRNSYCDTDPPLVAAACCYVASKAEETPVHVKVALTEARTVFNGASELTPQPIHLVRASRARRTQVPLSPGRSVTAAC